MILSTNQYYQDINDSPELRAVCLDVPDGVYTVMTEEEAQWEAALDMMEVD